MPIHLVEKTAEILPTQQVTDLLLQPLKWLGWGEPKQVSNK